MAQIAPQYTDAANWYANNELGSERYDREIERLRPLDSKEATRFVDKILNSLAENPSRLAGIQTAYEKYLTKGFSIGSKPGRSIAED